MKCVTFTGDSVPVNLILLVRTVTGVLQGSSTSQTVRVSFQLTIVTI